VAEAEHSVTLGDVQMVLGIHDGKVMQRFEHATEVVLYESQNALDVAEEIARLAFEVRDGMKPAGPALKTELIERHRMTLTARVALMLRTLRADKMRTDGEVAQAVVEACLKEVF